MGTLNWEPYYKRILALSSQGLSFSEIASVMTDEMGENVTKDAVRHALDRARESVTSLSDMPKAERIPYVTKYLPYLTGEKKPEPKDWDARTRLLRKAKAKVLVHADLHVPFHDEAKIVESINKNLDADAYVVVADFLDAYELSVFDKGFDLPFVFELDEALRIMEYISQTFPFSEILEANHEHRVRKQIERNLPTSLQFLAEKHILKVLAAPFPNILIHDDIWFFQLGSGIFCHPEKASKVEFRAVVDVYQHFKEWEGSYGLQDWNFLAVAHTHQMGVGYFGNVKTVETGCLSKTMGYVFNPKIPYKHPASQGYSVVTMNEGVINQNESREYRYPQEVIL